MDNTIILFFKKNIFNFSDFLENFNDGDVKNIFFILLFFILFFYFIYKIIKKIFYKKRTHLYKYRIKTPKNHRAITIGYIIDGKIHKRDIAGAIVQLYINNFLDIELEEEKIVKNNKIDKILKKIFPFLIKKSWVISRTLKSSKNILESEKLVLEYLFYYKGMKNKIKLSQIKGRPRNNEIFRKIEKEVLKELENFKYRNNKKGINLIRKIIKFLTFFSILVLFTSIFLKIVSFDNYNYISLYLFYILIIFSTLYLFFSKLEDLTKMTNIGNEILKETLGYKLYLKKVFRDRTNFFDILGKDRYELSRDIPYLISFGVNHNFDKLIKALEYDTEEKKDLKNLIMKIIFIPFLIIFSIFIFYVYFKKINIF